MSISINRALMSPLQQIGHRLTDMSRCKVESDFEQNKKIVFEGIEKLKTIAIASRNALLIQITQTTYPMLAEMALTEKISFDDAIDVFNTHCYFMTSKKSLSEVLSCIISFNRFQFDESLELCIEDTKKYCLPHVAEYLETNIHGRPYTVDRIKYIQGCIRNPRGKKNSAEKQNNNAVTLERIIIDKCPYLFTEEDRRIASDTLKINLRKAG